MNGWHGLLVSLIVGGSAVTIGWLVTYGIDLILTRKDPK